MHPSLSVLKFELGGYSPHLLKSSQWETDAGSYDRLSNLENGIALGDSVIVQNKVISFHTPRIVLTSLEPPFLEYKQVYSLFLSQDERKGFRLKVRILFRTFIVRFKSL